MPSVRGWLTPPSRRPSSRWVPWFWGRSGPVQGLGFRVCGGAVILEKQPDTCCIIHCPWHGRALWQLCNAVAPGAIGCRPAAAAHAPACRLAPSSSQALATAGLTLVEGSIKVTQPSANPLSGGLLGEPLCWCWEQTVPNSASIRRHALSQMCGCSQHRRLPLPALTPPLGALLPPSLSHADNPMIRLIIII